MSTQPGNGPARHRDRATDPYEEPENSTVDDWYGQSVSEDEELAERITDEEDGDLDDAERRFEREARGRQRQEERRD